MNAWADAMWLWSWQALVLIAGGGIVAISFSSRSHAQRYAFWLLVLVATACLPLASAVVVWFPEIPRPALTVPLPESFPLQTTEHRPAADTAIADLPVTHQTHGSAVHRQGPPAAEAAFWIWVFGTTVSLSGSVRSYLAYRRYRSAAPLLTNVSSSRGSIPLGYSSDVQVPVLVGFLHPTIVLPQGMEQWLTVEEQQAVILHEVAHYERKDHFASLLQVVIRAVLFFHPAVRYAVRQLALERELACDERVLQAGTTPAVYSEAILKIAECQVARREIVSPAMNASGRLLDRRLQMIWGYRKTVSNRSFSSSVLMVSAVLLLAMFVLPGRVLMSQSAPETMAELNLSAVPPFPVEVVATAIPVGVEPAAGKSSRLIGTVREPSGRTVTGLDGLSTDYEMPVTLAAGTQVVSLQIPGKRGPEVAGLYQVGGGVTGGLTGGLTAPAAAAAQAGEGRITGRIFDQTGAAVPGVVIELRNESGALVVQSLSNEAGAYMLTIREPGPYNVLARLPGFQTHVRALDFPGGQNVTHNVLLRPAEIHTIVIVSAQKPAASAEPEGPIRIGGVISAPNLIYSPRPAYPRKAGLSNAEGQVVLRAVIGSDGNILSVQPHPSEGTDNLDLIQAAVEGVKQWRYRPALLNGMPIEFWSTITVNFSLED